MDLVDLFLPGGVWSRRRGFGPGAAPWMGRGMSDEHTDGIIDAEQIEDLKNEILEYGKLTSKWGWYLIGCAIYMALFGIFGRYIIDHIHVKIAVLMTLMWMFMPILIVFYGVIFAVKTHKEHKMSYRLLDLIDERTHQLYKKALSDKDKDKDDNIDPNNMNKYFI